jgi:hypothetical protein
VFEQYKLLVEDTSRLSDRRQMVRNIYLPAHTLLASGIALLALHCPPKDLPPLSPLFLIVLIVGGGMVLCVGWRRLIDSYKELVGPRVKML